MLMWILRGDGLCAPSLTNRSRRLLHGAVSFFLSSPLSFAARAISTDSRTIETLLVGFYDDLDLYQTRPDLFWGEGTLDLDQGGAGRRR